MSSDSESNIWIDLEHSNEDLTKRIAEKEVLAEQYSTRSRDHLSMAEMGEWEAIEKELRRLRLELSEIQKELSKYSPV